MTALDLSLLEPYATVTFDDYKSFQSVPGQKDQVELYFEALGNQAASSGNTSTENYAKYNEGVAGNNGLRAVVHNEFSRFKGLEDGVDLTVGNDTWLRVQYDRMVNDYNERLLNQAGNGDGYISFDKIINEVIVPTYTDNNLDPALDPTYVPLTDMLVNDQGRAQEMFDNYYEGEGFIDTFVDSLSLGWNAELPETPGSNVFRDIADQLNWTNNQVKTWESVVDLIGYLPNGTLEEIAFQNLVDAYNDFKSKYIEPIGNLEALFDSLADFSDATNNIVDDYVWAWDNPGSVLGELPQWVQDLPIWGIPGYNIGAGFGGGGGLDPLVFDLDGDGVIELTNLDTNGIHFDFWGDGYAEATGWVAPDDGMLTWDIDGSGDINAVAEMFGSSFPIDFITESHWEQFRDEEHGFARLGKQDLIINGGNEDGIIDANDAIWTQLNIWQDINQDGVSQAGELLSLDSLGITSIDVTNYILDSFLGLASGGFQRIIEGNTVTHSGTFTMSDSSTREVVDVWFNSNMQDTYYSEPYTLDVRTLFLPTLRGYGQIADLHIAMSLDNGTGGLLEQVQAFAGGRAFEQLFTQSDTVRTEMRDILMKWAGINEAAITQNIAYEEHGLYSYFPEFYFLRKFVGQESVFNPTWFDNSSYLPLIDPGVESIFDSWNNVLDSLSARMIFQSGGSSLFEPGTTYNPISDVFEGPLTLSQTAIAQLQSEAIGHSDVEGFWHAVAQFIDSTKGITNLTAGEVTWLDNAVDVSSSGVLTWSSIEATLGDQIITVKSTDTEINGSDYNDVMDFYWVAAGGLTIMGGGGDDRLYGGQHNDVLDGGLGNDLLYGGQGDDIYRYDFGHDVIVEAVGNSPAINTDIIEFKSGIDVSDLTLHYARQDSGLITGQTILDVQGRGTITVVLGFGPSSDFIDELHFADGTIVDFWDLNATYHGTDDNDENLTPHIGSHNGTSYFYGYGGDDSITAQGGQLNIIDGGAGNDILYGSQSNDVYVISEGEDYISFTGGGSGVDKIFVPQGYSLSDVSFYRLEHGISPYVFTTHDAKIEVNGLGSITIDRHFYNTSDFTIPILEFADGTVVDLLTQDYLTVGTPGNDRYGSLEGLWSTQDETFLYGQGNDEMSDFWGGDDTLLFGPGINFSSLTIERRGGHDGRDLVIDDGSGNSFTVKDHFDHSNRILEHLKFDDGSIVNISDLEITAFGTEFGEQLAGTVFGDASPDDVIYAFGGDDIISPGIGNDVVYAGDGNDYISDGEGDDIHYGGDGDDQMFGYDGNDQLFGEDGNDILWGLNDNDILEGGAGDDSLNGGFGNDILIGGGGNDLIDGGGDLDEAIFSSVFADYIITDNTATNGSFTVEDMSGTDGTDTLYDVERFVFSDGVYENGVFTPNGPAIIASEDFEGGASGWSNNQTNNTESASFTEFLGRFGNGNGSQQLFKTFALDGSQSQITVEFDFYRIDSWDNEPFNIYLNDNLVLTETYAWGTNKTAASGTFTGGTWERDAGTIGHFGFTGGSSGADWWKDGIYHYKLTLNTTDTVLKLGFGVSLDEAVANNESFGIDNLLITSDGGVGTPVNHDPVAQDDIFTGTQDVAVNGNVLADNGNGVDSDIDGNPLNVVAATGLATTAGGSVDILADGSFTYTPVTGFTGADSFTYALEDGQGGSDTGTVNLTVNPLGAPSAGLQASYYILSSSPSVISGIDFNAAPDVTEIVTSINQSTSGSFFTGGPSNNFAAKYEGYLNVVQPGDYTLKMTSDDGSALWIDGVKVIDNDGLHGARSISTTLSLSAGLHALQAQYFEAGGDAVMKLYWNGPDSGNQEVLISGGALSHGPTANNDPTAQDDNFTSAQDVAVTGNVLADNGNGVDSDIDGDPLNVVAVAGIATAQGGSVDILANGDFTYTPISGFTGADSFSYALEDGQGGSDTGTVNLTVNPLGAPSAGLQASYYVLSSSPSVISGIDFNAAPDVTEIVTSIDQSTSGSFFMGGPSNNFAAKYEGYLNVVQAGDYTLKMTSDDGSALWIDGVKVINNDGLHGARSISTTLSLSAGLHALQAQYFEAGGNAVMKLYWNGPDSGNQEVLISGGALSHGAAVNNDPVAHDDNFTGLQDVAVTGNVLADNGNGMDSDIDGNPLSVVVATGLATTQGGSVDLLADGSFTYTPAASFIGADNFTYTLQDGQGGSDVGTVNLTIMAPVASNVITDEDFEGGATGWSNNQTDNNESASFTEFLGRFGGSTPVTKTYALSGDQTQLTVAFDFYKIDSWDYEPFKILLDGAVVYNENFGITPAGNGSGTFTGGSWIRTQMDAGHLGFGNDHGYWVDAVYHYELTLDNSNTSLELGFGGNLNEPVPNESFGIDSLVITTNGSAPGEQLYGTSGADVFAWLLEDVGSAIDVVHEFNTGQGDALDVSDILTGYDPLADLIADFVQITDNGTNSFLAVDADGGADNFVQIATLANVTGLTNEDALEAAGNLVGV